MSHALGDRQRLVDVVAEVRAVKREAAVEHVVVTVGVEQPRNGADGAQVVTGVEVVDPVLRRSFAIQPGAVGALRLDQESACSRDGRSPPIAS